MPNRPPAKNDKFLKEISLALEQIKQLTHETEFLRKLAGKYFNSGFPLGAILIHLNCIEAQVRRLIYHLTINASHLRNIKPGKYLVLINSKTVEDSIKEASLGRIIKYLDKTFIFSDKDKLVKHLKTADKIKVYYTHELTKRKKFPRDFEKKCTEDAAKVILVSNFIYEFHRLITS